MGREVVPGQGIGLGAEGEGGLDSDVHDHDALGAEMEGQNLEGVGDEQTREANVVEDAEDPDEEDLRDAEAVGVVVAVVHGGHDGPEREGDDHARDGSQEERAATNLVDEEGGVDGARKIENGLAGRDLWETKSATVGGFRNLVITYTQLLVLVGDTGAVVDQVHVVGDDGVTGVLGDETNGHDNGKSPPVALGLHEVEVARVLTGLLLELEGLANLAVLELNSGIVGIAVGVVLGQDLEGLLVPVLGNEPSGRLRDDCEGGSGTRILLFFQFLKQLTPDEAKLAHGGHNLDESDGAPRPVARDV